MSYKHLWDLRGSNGTLIAQKYAEKLFEKTICGDLRHLRENNSTLIAQKR